MAFNTGGTGGFVSEGFGGGSSFFFFFFFFIFIAFFAFGGFI